MRKQEERREATSLAIQLYCCHHPVDDMYCKELEGHLAGLIRQGQLVIWYDDKMLAGVIQKHEIDIHISSADIILLLTSRDFFDSDHHWNIMEHALKLHRADIVHVIPVSVRPYDYESTPLRILQALPRKKTLSQFSQRDTGFVEVVKGIREVIETLQCVSEKNASRCAIDEKPRQSFSLEEVPSSPFNSSHYIAKGDILLTHRLYDEALLAYESAIRLDPNCVAALQGKVHVWEKLALHNYTLITQLAMQSSEIAEPQNDRQEDLE